MRFYWSGRWRPLFWGMALACTMTAAYAGYRHAAEQMRPQITLTGPTMGTRYTVKVVAPPAGTDVAELKSQVDAALQTVNRQMSTYDPDSELSRFNRDAATGWFAVSEETARVIDEAVRIGRLSGGAFDVTVGPLVNLWNFGPGRRAADAVPPDDQIAAARDKVGFEHIQVRLQAPAVRKTRGDLTVDLSGIAKGFAVDRVAALLESYGIENYLVEVGGETRTRGRSQRGSPWQIAVESPIDGARVVQKTVRPGNLGMATSGDYRNYFESDGVRYSHIIDPRWGRPVVHRLVSVSVLAPSCTTADALATALMVLGPEEGYALAVKEHVPALFLTKTDAGFEERMTPEFISLMQP